MTELAQKHPHPRDIRIRFVNDTHTYFIDGSSDGVVSTTSFIHSFFPHFNADLVLSKMKGKAEKYPNMSDAEIKKMWSDSGKEASRLGTEMHAKIENFYNGMEDDEDEKESKEWSYFHAFHNSIVKEEGLTPYRTEWSIFDESIRLAGQVDMIYRKQDGTFAIYDWKRVKELKMENPFEKGKPPLNRLDHCNRVHYSLQLNIYKRILEDKYGLKVSEMNLIILHPDNDEFIRFHVSDMSREVSLLFQTRSCAKQK